VFPLIFGPNVPHILDGENGIAFFIFLDIEKQPMELTLDIGCGIAAPLKVAGSADSTLVCSGVGDTHQPYFCMMIRRNRQYPFTFDTVRDGMKCSCAWLMGA